MTTRFCKMNRRDIASSLGEIYRLVEAPNYVCRSCARSSKDKGNLCKPQKIERSKEKSYSAPILGLDFITDEMPLNISLKKAKKALKQQKKLQKKLAKVYKKQQKLVRKQTQLNNKFNQLTAKNSLGVVQQEPVPMH